MKRNNRPKYIEKQLKDINDNLRFRRLKWNEHYDDSLFQWFTEYLIHNNWYRGFNVHYDKEVVYSDGSTHTIRALAGPEYETRDYYIQIW